jgi:hypothetical protein
MVVAVEDVVALDPSLDELSESPPRLGACRESAADEWKREPR